MSMNGRDDEPELPESHQPSKYRHDKSAQIESDIHEESTSYGFVDHDHIAIPENGRMPMMNETTSTWAYSSCTYNGHVPLAQQGRSLYQQDHANFNELFKKLISKLQEEFPVKNFTTDDLEDLREKALSEFKKVPTILNQVKSNRMESKKMQRSLSLRTRGTNRKSKDILLKLDRFKIKALHLSDQQDSQTATNSNGTK